MNTFRFVSHAAAYVMADTCLPFSDRIGSLAIREQWLPHQDEPRRKDLKTYCVVIEAEVGSRAELQIAWGVASGVIGELDRAWPYAMGEPLNPVFTAARLADGPDGWSSNLRKLDAHFAGLEGGYVAFPTVTNLHWAQVAHPPLSRALMARDRLKTLSGPDEVLHKLHYSFLKSTDDDAQLFLVAKCLELVRHLLPGKNDEARQKGLPDRISKSLTFSLHDLFGLANNRIDVRHVVRNPSGPTFHQPMSAEERRHFTIDADNIVRGLLCQRVGIEPFVIKR